ncbi:hypothetical protein [Flavihumibacter profundi]|uniref:hypothetical protein n=1 Tax=Flavihumibacter profundi TaxID=2716883 RepID=UPI001CC65CC5|nr:hypothetical protein [Flavihumibacter profundi]MBZ5856788.1 hypothetical protein [Flavihumibacter profundi]
MPRLLPAFSYNLATHVLSAARPLFKAEKVAAIEFHFDTFYKVDLVGGIRDFLKERIFTRLPT